MSQSDIYFLTAMSQEQSAKYRDLWRSAYHSGDRILSRSFARLHWRCRRAHASLYSLIES